jgi:hypothetical protein
VFRFVPLHLPRFAMPTSARMFASWILSNAAKDRFQAWYDAHEHVEVISSIMNVLWELGLLKQAKSAVNVRGSFFCNSTRFGQSLIVIELSDRAAD